MSNKPIVYWAAPNEVCYLDFAARNNKRNMVTNNLVKTRLISERILDNINSGDKVGIKIHAGEAYNTRYLRHDYVREVVEAVKEGSFHIYSVKDIDEGITILTGVRAGVREPNGMFEGESINYKVNKRLKEMAEYLKEFPGITLGRTKRE